MYTYEFGDSIDTVLDFIESFKNSQAFLMATAKALSSLPIDCFQTLKYTYAHLAIARVQYLIDKDKENLAPYALLWDIAKAFSHYSLLEITREKAYEDLLEAFGLQKLTQAEFTPIIAFDAGSPNYSSTTVFYMKMVVEKTGFYQVKFLPLYQIFKEKLIT